MDQTLHRVATKERVEIKGTIKYVEDDKTI